MSHVMEQPTVSINSLPNEVLIQALGSFETRSLLPFAAVCRRFRGIVGRLHFYRLVEATVLRDHEVILESYHPSDKLSTPTLFCKYLGTAGLTEAGEDVDLETLNGLYSRFRPYLGEEHRRPRARRPTTGVLAGTEEPLVEVPSVDVNLESGEPFSQLCTVTNLVKVGPRRGLFLSIANVTDGVIRIWRAWLQNEAAKSATAQQRDNPSLDDPSIIWTDSSKDVGLRFRVVEGSSNNNAPLLWGPYDDELPVSYTLEYQELIIRTNRLLLSLETSEAQQVAHAGAFYVAGNTVNQPCHTIIPLACSSFGFSRPRTAPLVR